MVLQKKIFPCGAAAGGRARRTAPRTPHAREAARKIFFVFKLKKARKDSTAKKHVFQKITNKTSSVFSFWHFSALRGYPGGTLRQHPPIAHHSTLGKKFFEKNFDVPVGRLMFHCMHGGYVSAGATRLLLR